MTFSLDMDAHDSSPPLSPEGWLNANHHGPMSPVSHGVTILKQYLAPYLSQSTLSHYFILLGCSFHCRRADQLLGARPLHGQLGRVHEQLLLGAKHVLSTLPRVHPKRTWRRQKAHDHILPMDAHDSACPGASSSFVWYKTNVKWEGFDKCYSCCRVI